MQFDDVAWERSDEIFDAWKNKLYEEDTQRAIANLIQKHRGGVATELCAPQRGSYNVTIRLLFRDGGSAIMRIPCPGIQMFPDEKLRNEVAVMRCISEKTSIPVPFVLYHGSTDECPGNLGPFIIMEWVKDARNLSEMLNLPGRSNKERHILDPKVDEQRLRYVYEQIADILLQLASITFDKIGAPAEVADDIWKVTQRPLTWDMNELVQLANCPPSSLLNSTFNDTTTFYSAMADAKMIHLEMQHNDAIQSAEDCRRKYIARKLFRKLAAQGKLHDPSLVHGPFRLWCDDLRPDNILVDDQCRILAVIDWEFTYAAPSEYTFNPPWWLLLETPEYWFQGIDHWVSEYEPRMNTFLQILDQREKARLELGQQREDLRMAEKMRQNWESGRFWIDYACRRSWAFDSVFWRFLDPKFFAGNGEGDQFEERLKLLGQNERDYIDEFVAKKVEESKVRTLQVWI